MEFICESDAENESFSFELLDFDGLQAFNDREGQEMLLQWGLSDKRLRFHRFRFAGTFNDKISSDYTRLLRDAFRNAGVIATIGASGEATIPTTFTANELSTSEMNMNFFDRLNDTNILGTSGQIRGTFNEKYDDVEVDDMVSFLFFILTWVRGATLTCPHLGSRPSR